MTMDPQPQSGPGESVPGAPGLDSANARDHLANERTFLAWLRTGIAIVVLGFAIGQISIALPVPDAAGISIWLGAAAIVAGVAVCLAGLGRYRQTRRRIERGDFRPAGGLIMIVAIAAAIFGLILASYLLYIGFASP